VTRCAANGRSDWAVQVLVLTSPALLTIAKVATLFSRSDIGTDPPRPAIFYYFFAQQINGPNLKVPPTILIKQFLTAKTLE
jgi:hypothetical protein